MANDIDREYWKDKLKTEECSDPLAIAINELNFLCEWHEDMSKMLPHAIKILDKERHEIVKETENRFSDIMSMIDAVNDIGDIGTTYEMTQKLCDFYKKGINNNG